MVDGIPVQEGERVAQTRSFKQFAHITNVLFHKLISLCVHLVDCSCIGQNTYCNFTFDENIAVVFIWVCVGFCF